VWRYYSDRINCYIANIGIPLSCSADAIVCYAIYYTGTGVKQKYEAKYQSTIPEKIIGKLERFDRDC
jgi:hypothetical protein